MNKQANNARFFAAWKENTKSNSKHYSLCVLFHLMCTCDELLNCLLFEEVQHPHFPLFLNKSPYFQISYFSNAWRKTKKKLGNRYTHRHLEKWPKYLLCKINRENISNFIWRWKNMTKKVNNFWDPSLPPFSVPSLPPFHSNTFSATLVISANNKKKGFYFSNVQHCK